MLPFLSEVASLKSGMKNNALKVGRVWNFSGFMLQFIDSYSLIHRKKLPRKRTRYYTVSSPLHTPINTDGGCALAFASQRTGVILGKSSKEAQKQIVGQREKNRQGAGN